MKETSMLGYGVVKEFGSWTAKSHDKVVAWMQKGPRARRVRTRAWSTWSRSTPQHSVSLFVILAPRASRTGLDPIEIIEHRSLLIAQFVHIAAFPDLVQRLSCRMLLLFHDQSSRWHQTSFLQGHAEILVAPSLPRKGLGEASGVGAVLLLDSFCNFEECRLGRQRLHDIA